MKNRLIAICLLTLFLSFVSVAQTKPAWITTIEQQIKRGEKVWKIQKTNERGEQGCYQEDIVLKSGVYTTIIRITVYGIITNPEETFNAEVRLFDQNIGRNVKKVKLENFDGEGFVWPRLNKQGWTVIKLRKNDIFIHVYAPTPTIAKRFTKYVTDNLP